ncbi:fumarate reductase [Acidihalobacter yilgarnensis]|uniref:Succinate dehydrogenase iron-sulfur subunit n=1 Tax=Acidihalobacter yilgarnensis TaxID=2819280 RepID=A0A1D8INQ3_9GAMM|nr:succinate dehydrogenase/fumarate reductase iron-sulfur subunit [Acidihalobacter yilgarnensis]AOU98041.1 fumarate reductase [Acidihalobacter yilgarnensis]
MTKAQVLDVSVWRGGVSGEFVAYRVPRHDNQTVLDVVTYIQRHLDPTLSYRFACRVGVCGSCAMTVNGSPKWTCRTHVERVANGHRLSLSPLRNLPVIKDLVVDMRTFFTKWRRARGYFISAGTREDAFARVRPDSAQRRQADKGIECINCAVCYAACDVVSWKPDYLGPAALNRVWTLINDARDEHRDLHLAAVASDDGCLGCHGQQACLQHCPMGLNPAAGIAGLKRTVALAALRGEL